MDGRTDGRTDAMAHGRTDEGHFYSPPPPTLGDNKRAKMALNCSPEFKVVIVLTVCVAVLVRIGFDQFNLGNHLPCLMGS